MNKALKNIYTNLDHKYLCVRREPAEAKSWCQSLTEFCLFFLIFIFLWDADQDLFILVWLSAEL